MLSISAFVIVWEGVTRVFHVPAAVLPAPSAILLTLVTYARDGGMASDVFATLRRLLIGMAIGCSLGILTGFMIAWYERIQAALSPLLAFFFSVPHIALVPLLIIWFGIDDPYKITLVTTGAFFVTVWNTVAGVRGIDSKVILATRNLGATDRQLFFNVIVPGSLPMILASLKMSVSLGLIGVIVAEMLVATDGLGRYIADGGDLLQTSQIFAGLLLAGLIGAAGMKLADVLQKLLQPHRNPSGALSAES